MDQVAVVPFGSPWSRRNVPPCCSARTARLPDPAERLFEHVKHSPFQHRPVALHGTRVVGREFDGDVPGTSLGTSNSGFDDVIEPTSGGRVVGRSVASNRFEVTDQRSKLGGLGAKIVKEGGVVVGVGELPGRQDLDVGAQACERRTKFVGGVVNQAAFMLPGLGERREHRVLLGRWSYHPASRSLVRLR